MPLTGLENKHVIVVGLGLTGQSCVKFLAGKCASLAAMDSRSNLTIDLPVACMLGPYDADILCQSDCIVISPGVSLDEPAIHLARKAGVDIIGDVELFARLNTLPVVAITGSNGKSTVTSLVAELLAQSDLQVAMGGNIGTPVLELLDKKADVVVLGLSSFQLESTHSLRPLVATILNVSDDHLDRHHSIENYQRIKQRIYHDAQYCVFNRDDKLTYPPKVQGQYSFGSNTAEHGFGYNKSTVSIEKDRQLFLAAEDCQLVGSHNMLNIQAAAIMAQLAGATKNAIVDVAKSFRGLSHRFELVKNSNGIRWINDSKATNVGATVAAITGLTDAMAGNLILIAGGDGKGADFTPLSEVFESHVSVLIVLGKDGPQLAKLKEGSILVQSLTDAVKLAAQKAESGDVVLLSPACASLDMFDNYQHRGECFTNAVEGIAA